MEEILGTVEGVQVQQPDMVFVLPEGRLAVWDIGVDSPIGPDEPLPPLPEIPRGGILVITGRAPIWRYGRALHMAHGSPAAVVAVYDPRLGAVVVASHSPAYREGDVIELD